MKAVYHIEIELDGDAFNPPVPEVMRILRRVHNIMNRSADGLFTGTLHDVNGNPCGSAYREE